MVLLVYSKNSCKFAIRYTVKTFHNKAISRRIFLRPADNRRGFFYILLQVYYSDFFRFLITALHYLVYSINANLYNFSHISKLMNIFIKLKEITKIFHRSKNNSISCKHIYTINTKHIIKLSHKFYIINSFNGFLLYHKHGIFR